MEKARKPAWAFFSPSQRQFFETLPPLVRVFRGCARLRVRGIAWTVDRAVAEDFARGHRGNHLGQSISARMTGIRSCSSLIAWFGPHVKIVQLKTSSPLIGDLNSPS